MMKIDYRLCLVTDRSLLHGIRLEEAVEQAICGGCTMIQLREKNCSAKAFYELAKRIKSITDTYHVPLIINDRTDIAIAIRAAGVHVGQSDLPAYVIRSMIGSDALLGVSVTSVKEALQAEKEGADYLGVGALFPTNTKKDAAHVTLQELKNIKKAVTIPIMGIGGINKTNLELLKQTGIDSIAVISAILDQPNITQAAAELKQCL
ncbi:thiamine phosphate synthase [Dielma fastidiosa]|uniref:Thiamine-phosphate synthase n=1 Tax=Dielma fastidiosa TaxID=1034346 RepID=A0A318KV86_9FIRM|nr:thiamine phosphate synthase [Dielma fastidiosa]PXX81731.1 thiamine-phosphate diphosphorylase [Dielma fastidiosa]